MRDRQQRGLNAHPRGTPRGTAVEQEFWRAAVADDFDVFPQHTARMAGSERLHCRLFGGKASRDVGHRIAAALTIGYFPLGENAAQESLAVTLVDVADPGDVGRIEAKPENIHGPSQA